MKKFLFFSLFLVLTLQVNAQIHRGKVMEGDQWVIPTTDQALKLIMDEERGAREPAVAILRQELGPVPAVELDAFAEELGRIVRDGTSQQSELASGALRLATIDQGHGIPYTKSA